MHFDALYCNLVEAGEAGGILEALLDRLAIYQEKTLAIKSKIKSALMYPIAVIVVAFVVLTVIMIFVIPAFKDVFTLLRRRPAGAHAVRDRDVGVLRQLLVGDLRLPRSAACYFFFEIVEALGEDADGRWTGCCCSMPVFGDLINKSVDRALDAHAVHHVRRRRAAGRGARFGGRRLGQCGVRGRPPSRSRRTCPPARR